MNQHIIDAIAAYICVKAKERDVFTKEVDTLDICGIFRATIDEQKAAYHRAREILRDFIDWKVSA